MKQHTQRQQQQQRKREEEEEKFRALGSTKQSEQNSFELYFF
jgi:hypothetical protein